MMPRKSASTSLKSSRRSAHLKKDNKNASEPMWFRGVAASMGLCFDFGAVPVGERSSLRFIQTERSTSDNPSHR